MPKKYDPRARIMWLAAIYKFKFIEKGRTKKEFIDSLGRLWDLLSERDRKYILGQGHKHVKARIRERKEGSNA
jgi:hypothetical protein